MPATLLQHFIQFRGPPHRLFLGGVHPVHEPKNPYSFYYRWVLYASILGTWNVWWMVGSWKKHSLQNMQKNVVLGVTSQHPGCRSKIYPINDSAHTVDVRNPAPRTMRHMLVLPHYQNLLGHPKWCRIFVHQPYHTARVRESAWFLSTKVKAITSIEKVRALGVGCRGPWKWRAGTRKMEVGGRWFSFSSGWFLVSSCYFSGVSMSELNFFQAKLAPLPIFPLTVRYCNYENYYFFFDLVFLMNFLCETAWRLINYSFHRKAFLWRNLPRFRLVHPWSLTARP